ncbi:hypothetical protein BGZ99_008132 [Dissophora globulifera]|uniref:Uncharacterized protein n=1 Tax=Dissophora globulifera TaxID=979702 RepID=A0A9P6RCJ5_9FUNG|nr:hypothetical protein BGZ99_008132 [Dissophora globulifera]
MPGSHPSNSPPASLGGAMDGRFESSSHHSRPGYPHRHPQLSQHHSSIQVVDDENEMTPDVYSSGASSPSGRSTVTSSHISVDHTSASSNGISSLSAHYHDTPDVNFTARFSDFVRSVRRDASSDYPVIDTYIHNEDYQSLLAAVSNIQMSYPQSQDGPTTSGDGSDMVTSGQVHTAPHGHVDLRTMRTLDDGYDEASGDEDLDTYMYSHRSPLDNIYDLQHIMVHNQRQLEDQIRYSRESYVRHRDSGHSENEVLAEPAIRPDILPPISNPPVILSPLLTADGQPLQEPYLAERQYSNFNTRPNYDPRPTISSSYFSPTTESTIVLSSPPPGRTSSAFSYSSQGSAHSPISISSRSDIGHTVSSNSAASLQHVNGPYRPFITGRELHLQREQNEELLRSHEQSVSVTVDVIDDHSDFSDDAMDHGDDCVLEGESEGGHWSTSGSLMRRARSFEQHRYHYYRRMQLQRQQQRRASTVSLEQERAMMTTMMMGDDHLLTDSFGSRPASSLSQMTSGDTNASRRSPHTVASAPFAGSSIPIPARYINPQPFSHLHYTSPMLIRPHDIMTSNNNYSGYREPDGQVGETLYERSGISSSGSSRRRIVHSNNSSTSIHSFSETVERAEEGGWAPPSLSSTARSATQSWYETSPFESRPRSSHHQSNIGLKEVVRMACRFCETIICERGMKAQLLADQSVALLSTDDAPQS